MELQTFVAEALKQIATGIKNAQEAETGALFAPTVMPLSFSGESAHLQISRSGGGTDIAQFIEFDVAITISDTTSASGGAGLNVFTAKIGGGVESVTQNSTLSRVKFSLPVRWPEPPKS